MIKKHFIQNIFLAILLFICADVFSQNIWNKRASIGGSKRERGIGFSIGTRGYMGLGQDTLNLMINDFWEYDPGTNSWTQKANFPGAARRDAVGFSIGTKGYVGTGIDNADSFLGLIYADFWEYNPGTNVWTAKANYPGNFGNGVYFATGFSILNKGYICGGKVGPANILDELWEFTPSTNSWLQKANYPAGNRYGGVAFTIGNYGYFGTGTDEAVLNTNFYKYDPIANTWTAIANFPSSARFSCSAFSISGKGYMMFGTDGGYKDELWQYDPAYNFWFPKASIPGGARRASIAFSIGGKGYAGTGKGPTGTRKDFWEYLPSITVGMDEHTEDVFVSVYPNPIIENATIQISEQIYNADKNLFYDIINLQGKIIQSEKMTASTVNINASNYSKGIYFIAIRSFETKIASKKIILQ
ncbi:kelch repeat-containing protein [soil metagenome]